MKEYLNGGRRCLWFESDEIERIMESELRKAGLEPTIDKPAVDVESFVTQHLKVKMDQYAEDLGDHVLGLTQFFPDGGCRILINRALSEELDREDDCPPGVRGRWRATVAHESSHVLLHRTLFLADPRQGSLFDQAVRDEARSLFRCSKGDVVPSSRAPSRSAPEEVQANMGMASLLMPRSLFRELATEAISLIGFSDGILPHGVQQERRVVAILAERFEVSKQAARIRLQTLGLIRPQGQERLL